MEGNSGVKIHHVDAAFGCLLWLLTILLSAHGAVSICLNQHIHEGIEEKRKTPGSSRSWGSWRRRQWGLGAEPRCQCRSERRGVLAASGASLARSHPWPACLCPGTVRPARCSNQGEWPCHSQLLHSHASKTDGAEIPHWPAIGAF